MVIVPDPQNQMDLLLPVAVQKRVVLNATSTRILYFFFLPCSIFSSCSPSRSPYAQMSPLTTHGSQIILPLFINREEATVKSPAEKGELRLSSTAAFHNNGVKGGEEGEEKKEELVARQGVSEQELTA